MRVEILFNAGGIGLIVVFIICVVVVVLCRIDEGNGR
jgi:hypothetical protein